MLTIDGIALRAAYRYANMTASQRALWCAGYPGADPNTCRYCGKYWRQWTGSKLDGHAACVVTDDFKQHLKALLRTPHVTYQRIADVIGVTSAVVRSWTYPIRSTPRTTR